MFKFFEKADSQLQKDVTNELKWDPRVSADKITVTAKDGIVTLRGSVPHFIEKSTAEQAVQRVGGVRAVADEIEVNLFGPIKKTDEEIAQAALTALEWNYLVPDSIKVSVDKGWITLRGEAKWNFERAEAQNAVAVLIGVTGVKNDMTVKSHVEPSDVKKSIEAAFKRSAERDGQNVKVTVVGNHVTLSGKVHSLSEIEDARVAAWNAPGVAMVENNLHISM